MMLSDSDFEWIVPEIYTRLTMLDQGGEFEIALRDNPKRLLGIKGGATEPSFTLTPVMLVTDGYRVEGAPVVFTHTKGDPHEIAGKEYNGTRVCTLDGKTSMAEWLKSDPWERLRK